MKVVLDTNVLVSGLIFGGTPGLIFLAAALVGNASTIVSGDKHLLRVSGWQNIEVLKPRAFLDRYIPTHDR